MAELYVKPGNRQSGWNDPPQFSYGMQQLQAPRGGGAQRGRLTRRVAAAAAAEETVTATPPPTRLPPPPPGTVVLPAFPPQKVGLLPSLSLRTDATKQLLLEAEEDCGVDDVLSILNEALANCRRTVRVCDDIGKRLLMLQQMWAQGKLSAPVRRGMGILTQKLQAQCWDAADEIHRSLMVDHVTEVSQWMVGIKRLIAETRNLPTGDLASEDYEQKVETCFKPECQ
ncbi:steroid receptor RNA activator 1 isoform X2 [Elgaria multicarinata webbii]|uniref:steroid receptor RNA activator 1 isoform X2 n=1 Tax=Elgaria multicarinata webbii TaxID=159646 RepID=UPI002FCCF3E7